MGWIALGRLRFRHDKVFGRGTKRGSEDNNSEYRCLETNPVELAAEHDYAL